MTTSDTIPNVAFSHIGIYVHDIALMEDFYRRVLGFAVTDCGHLTVSGQAVDLVFLSRDPNEHHQLVLASGRPEQLRFNPINQISFRVPDLAALRYFYQTIQHEEQVSQIAPVTHGNALSLYFRDPEGNRIELFCDTPWYCTQPCREPIDFSQPDELILKQTEQRVRTLPGFKLRERWLADMRAKME